MYFHICNSFTAIYYCLSSYEFVCNLNPCPAEYLELFENSIIQPIIKQFL